MVRWVGGLGSLGRGMWFRRSSLQGRTKSIYYSLTLHLQYNDTHILTSVSIVFTC